MPTRSRRSDPGVIDAAKVLATYAKSLERQPLAKRTRDAYRSQVGAFVSWLVSCGHGAAALSEPRVRDSAASTRWWSGINGKRAGHPRLARLARGPPDPR